MLVEFEFSNFRSFRDSTLLTMRSSREQRFRHRVPRFESRYRISVNPIAAIYGANASGKSNLLDALWQLRSIVVGGMSVARVANYAFKLSAMARQEPTTFKVIFMHHGQMYTYFLAVRKGRVIEEYLYLIRAENELMIFDRIEAEVQLGLRSENVLLAELVKNVKPAQAFVSMVAQMFAENAEFADYLAPFAFLDRIVWAAPVSDDVFMLGAYKINTIGQALSALSTGVVRLNFTPLNVEESPFSEQEIEERFPEFMDFGREMYVVRNGRLFVLAVDAEAEVSIHHVGFVHQGEDGGEVVLEWRDQSEGTKRIIAILPWLWLAANHPEPPILLIDELDQSLHTQVVQHIIQGYLDSCTKDTRAQLIFTAHDLLLMDLDYFRRDEIWIVEKDLQGESRLIGLNEYRGLRNDKDIRKSYLQGRFGGVPHISGFQLAEQFSALGGE